jgi:hypothetical protein
VQVLQTGALAPESKIWFTVAVLARTESELAPEYTIPPALSVRLAPVPPYAVPIIPPFQVPLFIVPNAVMLPCTALGRVCANEGTPSALVIRIELFAVARPAITFADEEYKSWFTLVVAG